MESIETFLQRKMGHEKGTAIAPEIAELASPSGTNGFSEHFDPTTTRDLPTDFVNNFGKLLKMKR